MLRVVIEEKWRNAQVPVEKDRQVVVNTLGNLAHIGSFHWSVAMGACIAQSSSMAMPAREFVNMTRECSLSLLVLYATFLSDLIRVARVDSTVADALKGLNQIVHTGVALNKQDEEWAYQNDLKIMTSYGTTETGPMMCSRLGTDPLSRLLRPFPGANPLFIPYKSMDDDAEEDGYYHSNDLFEPLEDGWIYRGRAGDWIKTLGGFCDTKSIEDNVRKTCADIIHDAVVVGTGRLHVCLVVESAVNGLNDEEKLALSRTIIDRTAEFNTRLFKHERVQDPKLVLVVDKGALPRTKEKGNVQRSAVERMFLEQLDLIAGTL
ncbi:acetyl-CoA synthetase-like protein [Dichomitus squalens]|uniref:Acetyl-CoA synthetase-like protein n=1 Tax=Dichomitus squalens (strain LYAD-421) TaxID=732165 RepID=R7SPG9_DICSQ|nr:acetyl-CoA synthetase-like protein [Dichomitus squalens LYAD-421 SS1]EJF57818.1 acetyl-CoA synthetase-like protein [Dichomitus squalens LYAD-421 SS1]TBU38898.1 acetyl-CoA synthetase-like protein [Dichomitus squalens]